MILGMIGIAGSGSIRSDAGRIIAALATLLLLIPERAGAQAGRAPVSLAAVTVVGESACGADAAAGDIGLVWAAARQALFTARRAATQGPPTVRVERFERERNRDGKIVGERTDEGIARTAEPFRTLPSQVLSRDGYRMMVEGQELLYAPDAVALLSEEFASDHCFRLVTDPAMPEAIGLAFVPNPLREVVDIAGTFWLDRETSALLGVDYSYRNAGEMAGAAKAGGRLVFGFLKSGAPAITAWEVRTPLAERVRPENLRSLEFTTRDTLIGVREVGARLTEIASDSAAAASPTGRLTGRVRDASAALGGLVGARVVVLGTTLGVRTDSLGRFAFDRVPVGAVIVRVDHERLRIYRVESRIATEIRADLPAELELTVPSGAAALAAVCPNSAGGPVLRGAIVARLVDAAPQHGVPNAAVQATWRGRLIPTRVRTGAERGESDELGHVILCDVSAEVRV